jgi:hypothetical protein
MADIMAFFQTKKRSDSTTGEAGYKSKKPHPTDQAIDAINWEAISHYASDEFGGRIALNTLASTSSKLFLTINLLSVPADTSGPIESEATALISFPFSKEVVFGEAHPRCSKRLQELGKGFPPETKGTPQK